MTFAPPADARPYSCHVARNVPIHYLKRANNLLDELENSDRIERCTEHTPWLAPAHYVVKNTSDTTGEQKLRFVTDYTKLNSHLQRTYHPIPSPTQISQKIPHKSRYFACFDLISGYHQVDLDESCRNFTAFMTHRGKYRYKVARALD